MTHSFFNGPLTYADRARRLTFYHFAELEIMEMLGGWSEGIVHVPLRHGFGYQMFTQACNVRDLRWALRNFKKIHHRHVGPTDEFVRLCERIWQTTDPLKRLVGLHRVLKPHLINAYEAHIAQTDANADANSVRALRSCVLNHRHDVAWGAQMIEKLTADPRTRSEAGLWQAELESDLVASGGVTSEGFAYDLPESEFSVGYQSVADAPRRNGYTYVKKPQPLPEGRAPMDKRFAYKDDIPSYIHPTFVKGTKDWLLQGVHDLWQGENITVDRCGRFICEFASTPFEMRFDMAQQAWEEARHIYIDSEIIQLLGGTLGMYPLMVGNYSKWMDEPDPFVRMAFHNTVQEGNAAMNTGEWLSECDSWVGNAVGSRLRHLAGDEIVHIGFGNNWLMQIHGDDAGYRRQVIDKVRQWMPIMFSQEDSDRWYRRLEGIYKLPA